MTTTLITGGNKGLGYETARRLIEAGHTVYLGARDPQRGKQAAADLGAQYLPLDVTVEESVTAAAAQLDQLDVLINNAGMSGPRKPVPELTAANFHQVFDLNVYGPVRMIHAFLPLLERSANPVIVNVSSGLGSIATAVDPDLQKGPVPVWVPAPVYGASKAALNMLTVQYARQLPNLRINTVDPGYTATDFNGNSGYQTVEEGADIIVRLALIDQTGPTAEYLSLHGTVPW